MEGIKTFYKNQSEVAKVIMKLVDSYWSNQINELTFIESIKKIEKNNDHLLYKGGDYSTILKQKCGKRRLEVISRILKLQGKDET